MRYYWHSLTALVMCFNLLGCGLEEKEEEYSKIYEKIKTNQYIWSYGGGGIYWIDNDSLVLAATVNNSAQEKERGIYRVYTSGKYERMVNIGLEHQFNYCLMDDDLIIKINKKSMIYQENKKIKIQFKNRVYDLPDGYKYSPLLCDFKKSGIEHYRHYLKDDAYIQKSFDNHNNKKPFLVIKDHKKIELNIRNSILSTPYYIENKKSYFGFNIKGNCSEQWWINAEDWTSREERICFERIKNKGASIRIYPSKESLVIENHGGSEKLYSLNLISNGAEYGIEKENVRGTSVSPDGCKVAYGIDNKKNFKREAYTRQTLKIINICNYLKGKNRTRPKKI